MSKGLISGTAALSVGIRRRALYQSKWLLLDCYHEVFKSLWTQPRTGRAILMRASWEHDSLTWDERCSTSQDGLLANLLMVLCIYERHDNGDKKSPYHLYHHRQKPSRFPHSFLSFVIYPPLLSSLPTKQDFYKSILVFNVLCSGASFLTFPPSVESTHSLKSFPLAP